MTVALTASHDARQTSAYVASNDSTIWLRPRPLRLGIFRHRLTVLRLAASVGLGAFLTFATASSAKAPVGFLKDHHEVESVINGLVPEIVAPVEFRTAMVDAQIGAQNAAMDPAPVELTGGYDPLMAIVPVAAAQPRDIQAQFIMSQNDSEQSTANQPDTAAAQNCIQFEERCVQRWLVETILRAADTTGVDPVYMMALADKESSFVPSVKAGTSSATGLFQFIAGTWFEVVRAYGAKHGLAMEAEAIQWVDGQLTVANETMRDHILGLRKNAHFAALMAAEMTKRDRALIESRIGRAITRSEFYFAHFFGVDSASRFMRLVDDKPKQSAPRVFPAAAKANRTLFFEKSGRKSRQLTVSEVYDKIDTMIDRRLGLFEDVATLTDTSKVFASGL